MSANRTPKIIAIAGGKGGVGKTVFSAMLGVCLAAFGRRTVLVDLDFSGATLHGYLNIPAPEKSHSNYFAGRSESLTEIIQQTSFELLDAITLQSDSFDADACKPWQKRRLFRDVSRLRADYVILDLGEASSNLALDSFLAADYGIILTTNDMLSVINTYSFVRAALLRSLKRRFYDSPDVLGVLDECGLLVDGKMIKPLHAIIDRLDGHTRNKFAGLNYLWESFRPKVVLNFAHSTEHIDNSFLLGPATKDLLNIDLDYWGHVRFDAEVWQAIRTKQPENLLLPESKASEDIVRLVVRHFIADEILSDGQSTSMWLERDRNILRIFEEHDTFFCTSKCLVWKNCPNRKDGQSCSRLSMEQIKKAGE